MNNINNVKEINLKDVDTVLLNNVDTAMINNVNTVIIKDNIDNATINDAKQVFVNEKVFNNVKLTNVESVHVVPVHHTTPATTCNKEHMNISSNIYILLSVIFIYILMKLKKIFKN